MKNWQGRIKFVDNASALEIVPGCLPSLLSLVVDEISTFVSSRRMELKSREMLIYFLKYNIATINPIHVSESPIASVSSFKLLDHTLSNRTNQI